MHKPKGLFLFFAIPLSDKLPCPKIKYPHTFVYIRGVEITNKNMDIPLKPLLLAQCSRSVWAYARHGRVAF